jgi:hypothetical protein
MKIGEIWFGSVDWIYLAHDGERWEVFEIESLSSIKSGTFLTSGAYYRLQKNCASWVGYLLSKNMYQFSLINRWKILY